MIEKKMIVANDLPGIGKVALAIALPVLNSCGIETLALPTVLLSSHTGGFPQVAIHDTGDYIRNSLKQWRTLEVSSDALFIGYCRNTSQLDSLLEYHLEQPPSHSLFVDPIMGDNGKLYSGFNEDYVAHMKKIARHATLLMPNITEASLLTDTPFPEGKQTIETYENLAIKVGQLGAETVLLTGVPHPTDHRIGVIAYQPHTQTLASSFSKTYPHHFFGTGDLLAALMSAFYLHGYPLQQSLDISLEWMNQCMLDTLSRGTPLQYGLAIEQQLTHYANFFIKGES